MIIKSKSLLCGLIIDHDRPQRWVCFKNCDKIESEPTFELIWLCDSIAPDDILAFWAANQLAIIKRCERIPFRQSSDLRVLMVGGDENVIRLVERRHKAVELFLIIVPIDLQVEVTAIDAAERVIAVHSEGEAVVVICLI